MSIDPQVLAESLQHLGRNFAGSGVGLPLVNHVKSLVEQAAPVLEVDGVGVLLLDEDGRVRTVAASGAAALALETAQEDFGVGPGLDVMKTGRPVAVSDISSDGRYQDLAARAADHAVRAVLSTPVRAAGEVIGSFNAHRRQPYEWTADMVAATEAFAAVLGTLLELSAKPARAPEQTKSDQEDGTR